MHWPEFASFFHKATGYDPFPYQAAFATGTRLPEVLHVPTGAGKTATAVLGWLWRRRYHPDSQIRDGTPRRLVYCLPVRVLVEQTYARALEWLANLGLKDEIDVHLLMGGAAEADWLVHPEREAILVGTQDMLLSRALNRGYGMSRFRWPRAFGLLNADVLWIVDEVQLMGAGLGTTMQLDAFRRRFGTVGAHHTVWMSATLATGWLETVDRPLPPADAVLRLTPEDEAHPDLGARLRADKRLLRVAVPRVRDRTYARRLAARVLQVHQPGTLTLVVLNTVRRAQDVYRELLRALGGGSETDTLLLHSRFRGHERRQLEIRLHEPVPPAGRVVVATQVVEAGVDLSARALFTELAPWPALVQRFGRCNRRGDTPGATVYWIDVEDKDASPYPVGELATARRLVQELEGRAVNPASLPDVDLPPPEGDLLRARDLLDLFDTTPDLSGNDVDVSRFVRDTDETNLQVFWRVWDTPQPEEGEPRPEELCPVPVGGVRDYLRGGGRRAWIWDHLGERWVPAHPEDVRPGAIVLLDGRAGGYDARLGWDPGATAQVAPVPLAGGQAGRPEAVRDDPRSFGAGWVSLAGHTDRVVQAMQRLVDAIPQLRRWAPVLLLAARWHDAGKAHFVFQETMAAAGPPAGSDGVIWAKAAGGAHRHARPHFRHELASALLLLQSGIPLDERDLNLAAYLVACHHGRVRLSIRSLPGERRPDCPDVRYALGVWEGDRVLPADLGGGVRLDGTTIDDLGCMELGRPPDSPPTWLERTLALRDAPDLGPFRLGYLEACLRAADARASAPDPSPSEVGARG